MIAPFGFTTERYPFDALRLLGPFDSLLLAGKIFSAQSSIDPNSAPHKRATAEAASLVASYTEKQIDHPSLVAKLRDMEAHHSIAPMKCTRFSSAGGKGRSMSSWPTESSVPTRKRNWWRFRKRCPTGGSHKIPRIDLTELIVTAPTMPSSAGGNNRF